MVLANHSLIKILGSIAQIYCVLNLDKIVNHEYEKEIWLYDKGNYNSLTNEFYNTLWHTLKSNDIDIYMTNITKHIINTSKKQTPNRIVRIRQSDPK